MKNKLNGKNSIDKGIVLLLIILAVLIIVFGTLNPTRFFSKTNFLSMAYQMPEFGLLCLGMMLVILTGGMNLALITSCTLAGILGAKVMAASFSANAPILSVFVGCLVMIVAAMCLGGFNGFLSGIIGVPGMLATLGTMALYEGISLVLTKGGSVSGFPDIYYILGNADLLGIPIPIFIYLFGIIVVHTLLEYSTWGMSVYLVGINPVATKFSGIENKKVILKVYILSGMMVGLAAVIMCSRYNSARYDYGSSYLMKSILAAVLGGVAIEGGKGKVTGVILSVAILQVLSSGLNLLNVKANVTNIIIGILLVVVLLANKLANEREKKKQIGQTSDRFVKT